MQQQYPDRLVKTGKYGAHIASTTTPDNINITTFRNYDDPISMLDKGATMNVKHPRPIRNYLNIKIPSNFANLVAKALDTYSYDKFEQQNTWIIHLGIRLYIKLMNKQQ